MRLVVAMVAAVVSLVVTRTSAAHPAGSTSINRYVGVSWDARGQVHIAYLLDFAELPAYAEIEQLDADHDGTVTPAEQRAYLDRRLPPIVAAWTIEIDGRKATARVTGSSLEVPPGERGLSTLRVAADVVADRAPSAEDSTSREVEVHVVDPVFGRATVRSSPWSRWVSPSRSGPLTRSRPGTERHSLRPTSSGAARGRRTQCSSARRSPSLIPPSSFSWGVSPSSSSGPSVPTACCAHSP
jgi:hypothetical protein